MFSLRSVRQAAKLMAIRVALFMILGGAALAQPSASLTDEHRVLAQGGKGRHCVPDPNCNTGCSEIFCGGF
jgi:hypothetical protein